MSYWQEDPEHGSKTAFVFLSVDVAGHSQLVASADSNLRMREVHEILIHVKEFVEKSIPEYRDQFLWDWAGDGGIFAFPASSLEYPTTERVVEVAIRLFTERDRMNIPYICDRNNGRGVHLHITLGRGDAYYVEAAGLRRSHPLNVVMKTKGPSHQTSILISDEILSDLPVHLRAQFAPLRADMHAKPIYAYVRAMDFALRNLAKDHEADSEQMEAAHCSYRRAVLNIAVGDRDEAVRAFDDGVRLIDEIDRKTVHRYYWRTIQAFYAAWKVFLREAPEAVFKGDVEDRRKLLVSQPAAAFFSSSPQRARLGNLLTHMEYIFEQLDILAQRVVNDPSGLTTLEVCQLLQRCGYSRRYESHAIRQRLERIESEMVDNHDRSLDGDCSICTAAAASCLLLARQDQKANELFDWLRLLEPFSYSYLGEDYTDAPAQEHALHYASMVLAAFADCQKDALCRDADLDRVKRKLLREEWNMPAGSLPAQWMRYRNISEYEVCSYILPNLLRYWLSDGSFDDEEKRQIADVLKTLAAKLGGQSIDVECAESPGRLYSARENVGSFALGLLSGIGLSEEGERIVSHALSLFETRAREYERPSSIRQQTLDSNVDRTRKMLNGWLLQWEIILASDEQALPAYARNMLSKYVPVTRKRTCPESRRPAIVATGPHAGPGNPGGGDT